MRTRLKGPPPLPIDLHRFLVPECVLSFGKSALGVEEKRRAEDSDDKKADELGVSRRAAENIEENMALRCPEQRRTMAMKPEKDLLWPEC